MIWLKVEGSSIYVQCLHLLGAGGGGGGIGTAADHSHGWLVAKVEAKVGCITRSPAGKISNPGMMGPGGIWTAWCTACCATS